MKFRGEIFKIEVFYYPDKDNGLFLITKNKKTELTKNIKGPVPIGRVFVKEQYVDFLKLINFIEIPEHFCNIKVDNCYMAIIINGKLR